MDMITLNAAKSYTDKAIAESGGGGGKGGATPEEHAQIYKNKDDIEQLNTDLGNYYNKSQTDSLLGGVGILSIKKATSFGASACLISGYGSDVTEGTVIYIDVMHEDIGRIGYAKLKKDTSGYSQYFALVSSEYEDKNFTFSWGGQGYQSMARVSTKDGSAIDYTKVYGIVRSGSNSVNYSTDEKVIGTWIDEKLLYQKTIVTTMPSTSANGTYKVDNVSHNISNLDKPVEVKGVFYTEDGTINMMPTLTAQGYQMKIGDFTRTYVALANSSQAMNGKKTIITVRYTKTTD